jgi:hypothetical protein
MRSLVFALFAAFAAMTAVAAQSTGTCSPPGTPTCGPDGKPVTGGTPPGGPAGPGVTSTAKSVNAVTATVTLGGGKAVAGAEGVALDPTTGLVYVGLNGNIVSACEGDATRPGAPPPGPGAGQMSIVNPMLAIEVASVAAGQAPIWPTVDAERGLVYMANSGGSGTISVHNAADGTKLRTITVGGKPHMGGLDFSTGLMVVGNTVRASNVIAEQNYASVVDMRTNTVVREFATSPAAHGMAVDQERDVVYFSAVGDGAIVAVSASTGMELYAGAPSSKYGAEFGNNNMLTRQASTRRLFQVNAQPSARGIIVVDEVTLTADGLVRLNAIPWGMWVDESQRLLFAAQPNANNVAVIDLDTLTHVVDVPVGTCPYAVVVDPDRRVGLTSNQGSPTENATASVFDLCPVYAAAGRVVPACPVLSSVRRRPGR